MTKQDLKIVFMGTPDFAVSTLDRLVNERFNVVAVVTQPDKPVGRHQNVLQPSAVKQYAIKHGIPVLQPVKMKDAEFISELANYKADIQVVVAFRMLPEIVWSMPPCGTFNVHAALLPQYRGAAPINWAIINGETQTGVTTFFLDHDIDTGRIILQKRFSIPDDADAEYVYDGLAALGADIAVETLYRVIDSGGRIASTPQDQWDKDSYQTGGQLQPAPKIFKDTCRVRWDQSAKRVYDFIRGLSPYPTAWTTLCQDSTDKALTLKIFKTLKTGITATGHEPGSMRVERHRLLVACADEWLELTDLQLAGKRRMHARDFLNGNHDIDLAHLS